MKVLFISPQKEKCGISSYADGLLNELTKLPVEVEKQNIPSNKIDLKNLLLLSGKMDLVHIQYEAAIWTVQGKNLFINFVRKIKKPVVVTLHEIYESDPFSFPYSQINSKIPFFALIKKFRYRLTHANFAFDMKLIRNNFYAKAIHVHNEHQKDILIKKGIAPEIISVLPYGVSANHSLPVKHIRDFWTFGTFGFINPALDYELVLNALSVLKVSWKYMLCGDIRLEEHKYILDNILKTAKNLSIENRIIITGYKNKESFAEYFNELDIYIAPFKFKSSSASLSTAISFGLPIVAPSIPIINDINRRIKCILTYKQSDKEDLLNKINMIIKKDILLKELKQASLTYANKYSIQNEAKNIFELYNKLRKAYAV